MLPPAALVADRLSKASSSQLHQDYDKGRFTTMMNIMISQLFSSVNR
jgi:hypothetical protein